MKRIEGIVRPEKLDEVHRTLVELGHRGIEVTSVKGHGAQGGIRQMWRCKEYLVDLLPKVRFVVVVADTDVDRVCAAIVSVARTGCIGDGKIFVSEVEEVVRVRTGERDVAALRDEPDVRLILRGDELLGEEAS